MALELADKKILLGITGGVAAYKAVDLASRLTAAGALVDCVMTAGACEMVRPKSFEAVTGRAVSIGLWGAQADYKIGHIALANWADVVVVAPATANIIGKIANGICDDLLSTVLCACWQKPVIVAPAMNTKMWTNPAVQRNMETIKDMNFTVVGPESGRLACGEKGPGRMAEPTTIIEAIENIVAPGNELL